MDRDLLRRYIVAYERDFARIRDQEIYKWRAVKQFQDNWNPDSDDFAEMLSLALSKTNNLMAAGNYWPREMIVRIAKIDPQFVRRMFIDLFDEEKNLFERIASFQASAKDINSRTFQDKKDFQDDRAIFVYLSLRYPDLYFFYKYEMFKTFCAKVDADYTPKPGVKSNIVQFMSLCILVREEISLNNNLLKLHKDRIGEAEYLDISCNILTQDFIFAVTKYLTLDKSNSPTIEPKLTLTNVSIEPIMKKYTFKGAYVDYASKAKRDKHIGDLGELLVVQYEQENCSPEYVDKIVQSAKSEGDGLGFDILSFDNDGNKKYIEVKTTKGDVGKSFYISGTELAFSQQQGDSYYLYRLYNFDDNKMTANLYILQGDLSKYCNNPTEYEVVPTVVS